MSLLKGFIRKSVGFVRFQHSQAKLKPSISQACSSVYQNIHKYSDRVALRDNVGKYTYANLFLSANELSHQITALVDGKKGERIMFLCPNDANYVITLWAIWMSGQIAVPLSPHHPKNILLYYTNDTNAKLLISTPEHAELMQRIAKNTHSNLHVLDDKLKLNAVGKCASQPSDFDIDHIQNENALIIYTSGTTGSPKGVVLTHHNLTAQINTLVNAWKWREDDVILHTLPLHHIHGIVNALLCPLYAGAKTVMLQKFDANAVWSNLLGLNVNALPDERKISVFMGVPTIYSKLIEEYHKVFCSDAKMIEYIKASLKNKVRLMVSGSAPLPTPLYNKWLEISGHRLLERYGMTETGMLLSNEYDSDRAPGFIGLPLPGVSAKLASEEKKTVMECTNVDGQLKFQMKPQETVSGELLVRGDGIFKEYYNRPQATAKEFQDGWFITGDMCEYDIDNGKFKMLGRKSADIIKSGGYKISALQIETEILAHKDVKECMVAGVEDEAWGEKICAVLVARDGENELNVNSITEFLAEKLPKYAQPKIYKVVKELPKNAMGKINKKQVLKSIFS